MRLLKKQAFFAFSIIFVSILSSCGSPDESHAYKIQTKDSGMYTYGENLYKNGLIYHAGQNDEAYFLEYDTFEGVPLCNKPNCTHSDSSCTARLCVASDVATEPVVYQDYIYYFTSTNEVVDSDDGKSQTFEIHSNCMRIALDTGEVETFLQFDRYDPTKSVYSVLDNGVFYFVAYSTESAYQNEDRTWDYGMAGSQHLCSVDFNTGTFQEYGIINDSPYADHNRITEGNSSYTVYPQVLISGIYDKKIYMYYQYVEDQRSLLDAIHDTNGDLLLLKDNTYVPWIYENKCFDIETGEMTVSDLPVAAAINENTYLYWDEESENYVALLEDGTEVVAEGFMQANNPKIVNGKIWSFEEIPQCFDIETKTVSTITNDLYYNNDAIMMVYVNGKYIVSYYSDETLAFDAVTEEELISWR